MLGPKILTALAASLVALVLQTTLISELVRGARPDLLLSLAASVGLVAGPWSGGAIGLVVGALGDLVTGRLIGLGMLTCSIAGLVSGLLAGRLFRENAFVPFVVGAAATVVEHLFFIWGARAFGVVIPFGDSLARVTLPTMWYNGLLTALSFPLVYRVNRKLGVTEPARR